MTMNYETIVLMVMLAVALVFDLRERRIPNWLICAGMAVCAGSFIINFQDINILSRVAAFGIGIAVLFVPFVMGGIGAGDVKLLGVIGLFTGIMHLINIALVSFVVGGVLGIIFILLYRLKKYKNLQTVFATIVNTHVTKEICFDDEKKLALPYSVPLAIGAVLVLVCQVGIV